eukprot:Sdes_comp9303_c0_seq2m790
MMKFSAVQRYFYFHTFGKSNFSTLNRVHQKFSPATIQPQHDLRPVSGIPSEQIQRIARVYMPCKDAMQSGQRASTNRWVVDFETQQRWENPTMGWCSNSDPMSNLVVNFDSKEAALNFVAKHGWTPEIQEPKVKKIVPKIYGNNFSWNKRTRVSTK